MDRSHPPAFATLVAMVATAGALPGCKHSSQPQPAASAAPSASSTAPPHAIPVPEKVVQHEVNPKGLKPYSGPTGTIAGTITMAGDEPPVMSKVLQIIPAACKQAPAMYAKLFRVDAQKHLADAFVTVTGYEGYIPARSDSKMVIGRGCAWDTRTIAMTFGQKLLVRSRGRTSYVPELQGAHMASQMVAIPGGDPITLLPRRPGRYQLLDSMHLFMKANVLVLKYSTFDVTGADGHYEIKGIPAGVEVTVTAFLPQTMGHVDRKLKIEPGKTTQVDLQLEYKKPPPEPAEPLPEKPGKKQVPVIQ